MVVYDKFFGSGWYKWSFPVLPEDGPENQSANSSYVMTKADRGLYKVVNPALSAPQPPTPQTNCQNKTRQLAPPPTARLMDEFTTSYQAQQYLKVYQQEQHMQQQHYQGVHQQSSDRSLPQSHREANKIFARQRRALAQHRTRNAQSHHHTDRHSWKMKDHNGYTGYGRARSTEYHGCSSFPRYSGCPAVSKGYSGVQDYPGQTSPVRTGYVDVTSPAEPYTRVYHRESYPQNTNYGTIPVVSSCHIIPLDRSIGEHNINNFGQDVHHSVPKDNQQHQVTNYNTNVIISNSSNQEMNSDSSTKSCNTNQNIIDSRVNVTVVEATPDHSPKGNPFSLDKEMSGHTKMSKSERQYYQNLWNKHAFAYSPKKATSELSKGSAFEPRSLFPCPVSAKKDYLTGIMSLFQLLPKVYKHISAYFSRKRETKVYKTTCSSPKRGSPIHNIPNHLAATGDQSRPSSCQATSAGFSFPADHSPIVDQTSPTKPVLESKNPTMKESKLSIFQGTSADVTFVEESAKSTLRSQCTCHLKETSTISTQTEPLYNPSFWTSPERQNSHRQIRSLRLQKPEHQHSIYPKAARAIKENELPKESNIRLTRVMEKIERDTEKWRKHMKTLQISPSHAEEKSKSNELSDIELSPAYSEYATPKGSPIKPHPKDSLNDGILHGFNMVRSGTVFEFNKPNKVDSPKVSSSVNTLNQKVKPKVTKASPVKRLSNEKELSCSKKDNNSSIKHKGFKMVRSDTVFDFDKLRKVNSPKKSNSANNLDQKGKQFTRGKLSNTNKKNSSSLQSGNGINTKHPKSARQVDSSTSVRSQIIQSQQRNRNIESQNSTTSLNHAIKKRVISKLKRTTKTTTHIKEDPSSSSIFSQSTPYQIPSNASCASSMAGVKRIASSRISLKQELPRKPISNKNTPKRKSKMQNLEDRNNTLSTHSIRSYTQTQCVKPKSKSPVNIVSHTSEPQTPAPEVVETSRSQSSPSLNNNVLKEESPVRKLENSRENIWDCEKSAAPVKHDSFEKTTIYMTPESHDEANTYTVHDFIEEPNTYAKSSTGAQHTTKDIKPTLPNECQLGIPTKKPQTSESSKTHPAMNLENQPKPGGCTYTVHDFMEDANTYTKSSTDAQHTTKEIKHVSPEEGQQVITKKPLQLSESLKTQPPMNSENPLKSGGCEPHMVPLPESLSDHTLTVDTLTFTLPHPTVPIQLINYNEPVIEHQDGASKDILEETTTETIRPLVAPAKLKLNDAEGVSSIPVPFVELGINKTSNSVITDQDDFQHVEVKQSPTRNTLSQNDHLAAEVRSYMEDTIQYTAEKSLKPNTSKTSVNKCIRNLAKTFARSTTIRTATNNSSPSKCTVLSHTCGISSIPPQKTDQYLTERVGQGKEIVQSPPSAKEAVICTSKLQKKSPLTKTSDSLRKLEMTQSVVIVNSGPVNNCNQVKTSNTATVGRKQCKRLQKHRKKSSSVPRIQSKVLSKKPKALASSRKSFSFPNRNTSPEKPKKSLTGTLKRKGPTSSDSSSLRKKDLKNAEASQIVPIPTKNQSPRKKKQTNPQKKVQNKHYCSPPLKCKEVDLSTKTSCYDVSSQTFPTKDKMSSPSKLIPIRPMKRSKSIQFPLNKRTFSPIAKRSPPKNDKSIDNENKLIQTPSRWLTKRSNTIASLCTGGLKKKERLVSPKQENLSEKAAQQDRRIHNKPRGRSAVSARKGSSESHTHKPPVNKRSTENAIRLKKIRSGSFIISKELQHGNEYNDSNTSERRDRILKQKKVTSSPSRETDTCKTRVETPQPTPSTSGDQDSSKKTSIDSCAAAVPPLKVFVKPRRPNIIKSLKSRSPKVFASNSANDLSPPDTNRRALSCSRAQRRSVKTVNLRNASSTANVRNITPVSLKANRFVSIQEGPGCHPMAQLLFKADPVLNPSPTSARWEYAYFSDLIQTPPPSVSGLIDSKSREPLPRRPGQQGKPSKLAGLGENGKEINESLDGCKESLEEQSNGTGLRQLMPPKHSKIVRKSTEPGDPTCSSWKRWRK